MKRFFKILFVFCITIAGLFFANVGASTKAVASANTYDSDVLGAFYDNENFLDLISDDTVLATRFNVLEKTNLELYDQNPYGTCYATSLAQMINLSYEYRTGEHIKLSASALALQIKDLFFDEGSYCLEIIENSYNLDYVSEFDFPYELARVYYNKLMTNNEVVNLGLEDKEIVDVEEYYVFPYYSWDCTSAVQAEYLDVIKRALVRDGALAIGIDYKVAKFGNDYIYDSSFADVGGHAVTLVGFDDSYSASNFKTTPSSDGAFIILNSWGTEQEIIYMSYEDFIDIHFIYGVADFVEPDENAEIISNVDNAYYEIVSKFTTELLSSELEIGYQISNTTSSSYLTQIELQPLYNTNTGYNLYFDATDVKIYINSSNNNLNSLGFELLGEFDISAGVNKIKLNTPVLVGSDFAIKIVVVDSEYTYGYFDSASQKFNALYNNGGTWQTHAHSYNNYNLVKTPFYIRTVLSDSSEFSISKTDNYQTATTNAVTYSLSSNAEITDVGVQIFKHGSVSVGYNTFELSNIDAIEMFDVTATTSQISIKAKNFVFGTFKVVITINGGEKTFIKFLCFDDGIILTTMELDPTNEVSGAGYYLRLYNTALESDEINVTIPSYYSLTHTIDSGTKFDLENIFVYDSTNISISESYSIDTNSRIAKATIVFSNTAINISRTLKINFIYKNESQIIYVTGIPNATHSNLQYVSTNTTITLKDASAPNHRFIGWYTSDNYSKKITGIEPTADGQVIYLYAKFEEIEVDCVVKKISYDSASSILTLSLDFSDYNLSTYDVIEFSSITHNFKTSSSANSFSILKASKYSYQVYLPSASKATINNISFVVKIKRFAYENYATYFPYTYLTQTVSVNDVLAINVNASDGGRVYNSVTNALIGNGNVYVNYGGYLYLRFEPLESASISQVKVDGVLVGIPSTYNFTNVKANHSIRIVFDAICFEISAVVNGNGSLDKGLVESVVAGESITYNFQPNEGSYLVSVVIDGKATFTNITSYTFSNVQENHTIVITFETYTFVIQATIVGSGSIGQPTSNTVEYGKSVTYSFKADDGFTLKKIVVDGTEIALADSYTFEEVKENHTISVLFEKDVISVSVIVEGRGSVSVYDLQSSTLIENINSQTSFQHKYNGGLKFVGSADYGYKIGKIYINGASVAAVSEFNKSNIIDDIEIKFIFEIQTFTVELVIDGSGVSNQPSSQSVNFGDSLDFEFTPSEGYQLSSVKINNVEQGAKSLITIENITSNKIIVVVFEIQTFEIKWYNFNEMHIATTFVNYGTMPVATFNQPKRSGEGFYVFNFIGWNTSLDGSGHALEFATQNETYYAQFEKKLVEYEIKASASEHGIISPNGNVLVEHGSNQTFHIIPDAGYHVFRVYVDGKIITNIDTYTFENVKETHTISATFKRNDFRAVVINNDSKGKVVGNSWFENGERAVYIVEPEEGYEIDRVVVNGEEIAFSNNSFVIESVSEELNIVVEYKTTKSGSEIFKNAKSTFIVSVVAIVIVAGVVGSIIIVKKIKKRKELESLEED